MISYKDNIDVLTLFCMQFLYLMFPVILKNIMTSFFLNFLLHRNSDNHSEYYKIHKGLFCTYHSNSIEIIKNKARHNLIDAKCRWHSDQLDEVGSFKEPLSQTKVMQIRH